MGSGKGTKLECTCTLLLHIQEPTPPTPKQPQTPQQQQPPTPQQQQPPTPQAPKIVRCFVSN